MRFVIRSVHFTRGQAIAAWESAHYHHTISLNQQPAQNVPSRSLVNLRLLIHAWILGPSPSNTQYVNFRARPHPSYQTFQHRLISSIPPESIKQNHWSHTVTNGFALPLRAAHASHNAANAHNRIKHRSTCRKVRASWCQGRGSTSGFMNRRVPGHSVAARS